MFHNGEKGELVLNVTQQFVMGEESLLLIFSLPWQETCSKQLKGVRIYFYSV